jgi:hypothetical protein
MTVLLPLTHAVDDHMVNTLTAPTVESAAIASQRHRASTCGGHKRTPGRHRPGEVAPAVQIPPTPCGLIGRTGKELQIMTGVPGRAR